MNADVVGADNDFFVRQGDTINLRCPFSSTRSNIDWAMKNSEERIVVDCVVQSSYTSLYKVTSTGSGRCDLIISNASEPHGGSYVCYNDDNVVSEDVNLCVLGKIVVLMENA